MKIFVTCCCTCNKKIKCHKDGIDTKCTTCPSHDQCTLEMNTNAELSHGLCEECFDKTMGRITDHFAKRAS